MATSAPLALAVALASTQATAAGLPVPSIPPPNEGTRWVAVAPGPTAASVTVSGSRAYAEWQSFDVAAGNTFTVNGQVGKDWILVNKVVGAGEGGITPSMLAGTVAANGQVWLINPAGIIVSNTGVFNVGGLLLSTAANFDNQSYLAGGLNLNFSGATAAIQMAGSVNASGGLVAFLAPVINIGGQVRETSPGVAQVAAVAAQDVSLVFTDTGAQLALDGVTINYGSDVGGDCDGDCSTPGGITQTAGSQITASRIILAAAGANLSSSIVVSGGLTATRARADGQDIVLIVADPTGNASDGGPSPELSAGAVVAGATTTNFGGDITVDTPLINTLATSIADPLAANGASLFIRDAGNVHIGTIVNAVGDVDILAQGAIDQVDEGGGNISARDIALASSNAATVGALNARDDVVAQVQNFTAASITAGATVADQGPVDAMGAADRQLGSSLPGHNVNLSSAGSINILGATNALPDPLATTLQSDVVMVASGAMSTAMISTGAITAGRDISLSLTAYGEVTTGDLQSGRDIAVSTYGGISVAAADAGDDIVMRAYQNISVPGALTTHGSDVSTTVDPNQPADLLAASSPISIGETSFALTGSSIDLHTYGSITVGGQATAMGPRSDVRLEGFGVTVAGVNAGQDILLYAHAFEDGPDVMAGDLVAGRDIALIANEGAITLNSAVAGDDIVLRAYGDIVVNGVLTTQGADVSTDTDPNQAGDVLAASDPIVLLGQNSVLTGSSIDVGAGRGGAGMLMIGGAATAVGAQSDARFQAPDNITLAGVSAGRDVVADTPLGENAPGSLMADNIVAGRDIALSTYGGIALSSADAGDDIVMRSYGDIAVTGMLTTHGADVSTTTDPNQPADLLAASNPTSIGDTNFALTGSSIDLQTYGAITVGGQATAAGPQSDVRMQGFGVSVAGVSAGQDILLSAFALSDGPDVVAGDLVAGRDIALVASEGAITLNSAVAGDDIVMRAYGDITIKGVLTTQGADVSTVTDPNQAGDVLAASDPLVVFGQTTVLTGSSIDVGAGRSGTGILMIGGLATVIGAQSDARFVAPNAITLAGVSAGEDVVADTGFAEEESGSLMAGDIVAGRDIALRTQFGPLTLASGNAGDDVVLRSPTSILVTGTIATQGADVPSETPQPGDLLASLDPIAAFNHTFALTGSSIDLKSGTVTVQGAMTAVGGDSDIRVLATSESGLSVASATAGEDILLDTPSASVIAGALQAGRDVAIRGQTGIALVSASAADDIVLRASGGIMVSGGLATRGQDVSTDAAPDQAGDLLYAQFPTTEVGLALPLTGSTIDVQAQSVTVKGASVASGTMSDARFNSTGPNVIGDVNAGQDVIIGSSSGVSQGGKLVAGRDISVGGTGVIVASGAAGGDIIMRATGPITVAGTLTTNGKDPSPAPTPGLPADALAAAHPIVDFGVTFALTGSTIDLASNSAITVGGQVTTVGSQADARFDGVGVTLAGVKAGRDILIDSTLNGSGAISAGSLVAGRDIAARSGSTLSLASASAGSDIVLRAPSSILVTSGLVSSGTAVTGADPVGVLLAASDPITAFGTTFALVEPSIDVKAGTTISVQSAIGALGGDSRLQGPSGIALAAVSAGEDVLLDSASGAVSAGNAAAGRDIAIRGVTSVSLASGKAGDDIVLRGPGQISVSGSLITLGQDVSTDGAPTQAGDVLAAYDPITAFNTTFALTGSSIDIKSNALVLADGGMTAFGTASDVRIQSLSTINIRDASAGEDILLDAPALTGGGVSAGNLNAGRDVAVRSSSGVITLDSANAADDVVLRSTSSINIQAGLSTQGVDVPVANSPVQAGDLLAALDPISAFGATFALNGSSIDVKAGGAVMAGAAIVAVGPRSDVRIQTPGNLAIADASAGEDVLLDGSTTTGMVSAGNLVAGRDIGVRSSLGALTLISAQAGDDLVLRSPSTITVTGGLATLGNDVSPAFTSTQAGDLLYALSPLSYFGQTLALTGSTIDVNAGAGISVGGQSSAAGTLSDARFESVGPVSLAGVTAAEDVVIGTSAGQGAAAPILTAGALVSGRDIAVNSAASVSIGSGASAVVIVIRAQGAVTVAGSLSAAGQVGSPGPAASLLYDQSPTDDLGASLALVPGTVDIGASGAITVGGTVTAGPAADARFIGGVGVIVAAVSAGEDVLIDSGDNGAPGAVSAGVLSAGRDVAVRSGSGAQIASATAGDDIVIRAPGAISVTGVLTTLGQDISSATPNQAGDLLFAASPNTALGGTYTLAGSNIDIVGQQGIAVSGQSTAVGAASDARFQSSGAISLGGVTAGEDVVVGTSAGQGLASTLTTGALIGGRDIAVSSAAGAYIALGAAGGVIVIRAQGPVTVAGGLSATGQVVGSPGQAAALLYSQSPTNDLGTRLALVSGTVDIAATGAMAVGGTVSAGPSGDARFVDGAGVTLAAVSAGEDVLVDGGAGGATGAVLTGALSAGRDVAVRSGAGAQIASATAGDDIVIRAPGAVSVAGVLTTLGLDVSSATQNQAGDLLFAAAPNTALGGTYTLAGSNIDIVGQQGIAVSGQSTAAGASSDARFQSAGAISLAGVTAGRDIVIEPTAPAAGVSAGALIAGRDIAAQALAGPMTLVSAQAGDDIVLRTGGALTVSGALTTTGSGSDTAGAGDQLAALDSSRAFWAAGAPAYSASGGHDIDIRAAGSIVLNGALTANGAGAGVRIDSYGAGGTVSTVGITIAGGAGSEQVFIAGSDLALTGAIDAPTADVLLFSRSTTGVTTLGGAATGLGGAFTFDNTEVAQVTAASLDLFSGVDPARTGNIAVQNLTFTQGLQTIRAYSGAGSRVDVFGVVSDPIAGGRFDIGAAGTDTTLPKFALNGQPVVLLSTWRPDVIRIAGTIGVTGAPLTDLSLAGQSIYIAPEPDTALASNFEQASQSTATLPLYAGSDTLQVFTGTLELRASGQILERDLQTTSGAQGAGLEIGKLVVDRLDAGGATPSRLSLYGVINQNLNGIVPPPNPADLIGGRSPSLKLLFSPAANASVLFPQPAGTSYTFNGCALGTAAGCNENGSPSTPTDVFLYSDSLLQDALASDIPPRIVIRDVQDVIDPYTPVEEEGVTNMGGEVGWTPETEPQICPSDETTLCKNGGGSLNPGPSR